MGEKFIHLIVHYVTFLWLSLRARLYRWGWKQKFQDMSACISFYWFTLWCEELFKSVHSRNFSYVLSLISLLFNCVLFWVTLNRLFLLSFFNSFFFSVSLIIFIFASHFPLHPWRNLSALFSLFNFHHLVQMLLGFLIVIVF